MKNNKNTLIYIVVILITLTAAFFGVKSIKRTDTINPGGNTLTETEKFLIDNYENEIKDSQILIRKEDDLKDGKLVEWFIVDTQTTIKTFIQENNEFETLEMVSDKGNETDREDENLDTVIDKEIKPIDSIDTKETIPTIVASLYDELGKKNEDNKEFVDSILGTHIFTNLNKENTTLFLGNDFDFKEGFVSESGIGTHAYSLMIFRSETPEKAKKLVEDVKKSVNPDKWICVRAENTESASNEDLTLVVMGEKEITKEIVELFKNIKK